MGVETTANSPSRVCSLCKQHLSIDEFHKWKTKLGQSKVGSRCKKCNTTYCEKSRDERKAEVMSHYGGKCSCCGETHLAFLTLDHTNNDGASHRRTTGQKGNNIYRWVKKNNYPSDLTCLCYNCNCGRHANGGVCPHKLADTGVASSEPSHGS